MSLNEVWEAASATPFHPLVAKDSQFAVGFTLLLLGMDSRSKLGGTANTSDIAFVLTGLFGLSTFGLNRIEWQIIQLTYFPLDRSFLSLASLGVPASLLFG